MYKTLHRKAKIEQHEPQWKPRVNTAILKTFENTEEAIKIGQSGETSNIGHNTCRTPLFTNKHITQSLSELVVLATILAIFQDRTSPNNTSTQFVLEIQ